MGILAYYGQTAIKVIVSGIRHLLPPEIKTPNKLDRQFGWIRSANLGPVQDGDHYVHVASRPSPNNQNAFDRKGGGRAASSENDLKLRSAHVLALYDLQSAVRALRRLIKIRQEGTHRTIYEPLADWEACCERLKLLEPGDPIPAENIVLEEPATLLRDGNKLAIQRFSNMPSGLRGKLPEADVKSLESANDEAALRCRIADGIALSRHLTKARLAERQLSSALRYVHRQTNKGGGRRPFDASIERQLLGSAKFQALTQLELTEMVQVSLVSAVCCSEVWPKKHGSPETFDFHRLFDIAVLIGQLERGQTISLSTDMATYFLRELLNKGDARQGAFDVVGTSASILILASSLEKSVGYERFQKMACEIRAGNRSPIIDPTATD